MKCIYCEEPAGFLKRRHKKCQLAEDKKQQNLVNAKNSIVTMISSVTRIDEINEISISINNLCNDNNINCTELQCLIIDGWRTLIEQAFDDGILSEKEEEILATIKESFKLPADMIQDSWDKIVKGAILRDIFNGIIPERMIFNESLPFNLQKTEKIAWVFQDVNYYETVTKTQYSGGSQGVSIRIAKGLYYRVGAFKGEKIQTDEIKHLDNGLLGITNKHLYFVGDKKKFRIKFEKIMAFEPYADGIELQRDLSSAKPQTFVTNDGWFTYNLVTNLAQLHL